MGNINLNNFYRPRRESLSTVDRRMRVGRDKTEEDMYSDLLFDMEVGEIQERPANASQNDRDLVGITDEQSVLNSLHNILSTRVGSRLLNPEAEVDLETFLFEPITQHKAYFIGYTLYTAIPAYEPRVSIDSVKVQGDPDEKCYNVEMGVSIPSLGKSVKLSTVIGALGRI